MINQEEKNEGTTVDANQNTADSQANVEKGPFDGEDRLDIDTGEEEKNDENASGGKPGFNIKTLIIVALLLLPVIYIIYKSVGNKSTEEQVAGQPQQMDVAVFENAARTNPTYENLLNLSNAYINQGMAGKSIEPLEKAITLNPKSAVAYSNLGFAYSILQQYGKGIENLEKAIELDTAFQLAKNNLNWARGEQKKILVAIQELEKTPEDKKDSNYYIQLGLNYLKLQDYDKSIEIWNKVFIKDPKNVSALNNIGVAYMSKLDYDKAVEAFKKGSEYDPTDQLSKNNMAWALDEKGKADKAKAEKK